MEDNSNVVCNEALEEIDQNIVKIEVMNCENFETKSLAINLTPPIEEYNTTTVLPKRRSRHSKKSLELIKLQYPTKLSYCPTDLKLGLWKDRFRPIRPKPLPTAASRPKSFGMSPTLNTPTLTPNASVPNKDKTRNLTTVDSSSKTNHCTNNGDNRSITSVTKKCKTTNKNINVNANLNTMTNDKSLRNTISNKTTSSISHKSSVELFFASMAQTVLNLPREVQADIKMQICKIVTMAEVKYSGLQVKTE